MYLKKLKIGEVELENNILLAPMAGITDLPFRKIAKKFGVKKIYVNFLVELDFLEGRKVFGPEIEVESLVHF